MSKRNRRRNHACREQEITQIESHMEKFQQLGLVGETQVMPDGEISWRIGPEHAVKLQFWMQEILGHPERWHEVPGFKGKEAMLLSLREEAIKKGYIQE